MIEKPKRPKQPNIQDRQPPRTLQELINRYDLDNTKIYNFLDELVKLLNTEKKSIDTSINDLNNNKVNKSGDEMTGQLNMQSNPIGFGTTGNIFWKEDGFGDKFRILPYFSGSGSDNKLVIQSTNGDAGTDPQNWKDLVYIHADTGEINLIDILTCNRIQTDKIDLNNGAFAPRCFQLGWGTTFIANTEVGGHGLIMVSEQVLYMFWIAGGNHDQLSVRTIWGNSNFCQVTMTDNAHLKVTTTNGDNMTCSILFIRGN